MKKLSIIMMTITILIGISFNFNVYAIEKGYGYINIEADVPLNFEKNILINFTLEDGTNALYRLETFNNFKVQEKMPVGNHKIDFISILNDTRSIYKVEAKEEIQIEKDISSDYKIEILNAESDKEKKENIDSEAETNIKQEELKKDRNTRNTIKDFMKSYIVTLSLFIVLGIVYIIIRIKK